MNRSEFLSTRSTEYLEAMSALRRGEVPLLIASCRLQHLRTPTTTWRETVKVIQWLVRNRQDTKHANCFHTSISRNYQQYLHCKSYYVEHIKDLPI